MEAMEQRIKSLEAQVKQQNAPANASKPAVADVTGANKQSDQPKPDKSKDHKSQTDKSKAAEEQSTKPGDAASDQSRTAKLDKAAGLDKAVAALSADKPIFGLMESPVTRE